MSTLTLILYCVAGFIAFAAACEWKDTIRLISFLMVAFIFAFVGFLTTL